MKSSVCEIDLHGYHHDDIDMLDLVKQAWETGSNAREVDFAFVTHIRVTRSAIHRRQLM